MTAKLFKVRGAVQSYDWGGYSYIKSLLGDSSKADEPSAEYWLGTHPNAPSMAIASSGTKELAETLDDLKQPALSFLMKILDVRMMLSIQVHPSIPQAEEGYAREEAAGIPLKAKNRTYRDKNHKPELMFALSRFWMLHGLKSLPDIENTLRDRPACRPLLDTLSDQGIEGLVALVLQPDNPVIESVVANTLDQINSCKDPLGKLSPEFWMQRWLEDNPGIYTGILMILLMNIIELKPGEAIYQPERLLHAYLEGQNIEIMANSDNVLRAGLTSKHIDTAELVKVANFESTDPEAFKVNSMRDSSGIRTFDTPYEDFLLKEIEVPPLSDQTFVSDRSQILLFFSGEQISVTDGEVELEILPGESCFSCIGNSIHVSNPTNRTAQVFIGS